MRAGAMHFLRSRWSVNAFERAYDGGHLISAWPCWFSWSHFAVFRSWISRWETNSVGTMSATSSPRAISDETIAPLYQYTDHEPPDEKRVESIGPRSKNAISCGFAGSVQS